MSFAELQTLKEIKLYNLFEKLLGRESAAFLSNNLLDRLTDDQIQSRQSMFRKLEDVQVYEQYKERYEHLCIMEKEYEIYIDKQNPMYSALVFFQMANQYYYFTDNEELKKDIEILRTMYEARKFFNGNLFSKYDNQRYSVELKVITEEYVDPLQELFDYLKLRDDTKFDDYRLYGSLYEMVSATDTRPYTEIENFYAKYKDILVPLVEDVIKELPELRFFLEMKRFYNALDERGIPYTMAEFTDEKSIHVQNARDITLITSNVENIITNDFYFTVEKPFWFITGANGGGKTSFLRSIGLCVLLGSQGCYMPAKSGTLMKLEQLITFFPMESDLDRGRFNSEKERLAQMSEKATENSLVLMNEVFTSTDENTAMLESRKVLDVMLAKKSFGVFVTHNFPLIESMQNEMPVLEAITEGDEHNRLFRIIEKKQVGSSFAADILRKYKLDRDTLVRKYGDAV